MRFGWTYIPAGTINTQMEVQAMIENDEIMKPIL